MAGRVEAVMERAAGLRRLPARPAIPWADRDGTLAFYAPGQPIPALVRDPVTGRICVNALKLYVKPHWLSTSVTLAGNALSEPLPLWVDGKAHMEIYDAFYYASQSAGFTVELFDADDRPLLMNREVHVGTIASGAGFTARIEGAFGTAGSAGRPFRWPETFWLDVREKGGAIFARLRNLSASENACRLVLLGRRWYHVQMRGRLAAKFERIYLEARRTAPFFYTTDGAVVELSASGTASPTVRFGDDAWTEWCKIMSISTGRYNIQIVEDATDKRFMEAAVRDDTFIGNGEMPGLLWESSLFEPNFRLKFYLTDLSGNANTVWLTLACRRIKPDPREDLLRRPGQPAGV